MRLRMFSVTPLALNALLLCASPAVAQGPYTLTLTLNDDTVGRGGMVSGSSFIVIPASVTPTVVVRDGMGMEVIPTPPIDYSVTGVGSASGSGAFSAGTIQFTEDASSKFDIRAALHDDPTVNDTKRVLVVGAGVASITLDLAKFGKDSGNDIQAMLVADAAGDRDTFVAKLGHLVGLPGRVENRPEHFAVNKAFNPQQGWIPTHAQIVAGGLPDNGPDDVEYAAKMTDIQAAVQDVRAKIIALPVPLTQSAIDDLTASLATLRPLLNRLQVLQPTAPAFVDSVELFNSLCTDEMPELVKLTANKVQAIAQGEGFGPGGLLSLLARQAIQQLADELNLHKQYLDAAKNYIGDVAALLVLSDIINSSAPPGLTLDGVCGASCSLVSANNPTYVLGDGFAPRARKIHNFVYAIGGPGGYNPPLDGAVHLFRSVLAALSAETVAPDDSGNGRYFVDDVAFDDLTGHTQLIFNNGFPDTLIRGIFPIGPVLLFVMNLETGRYRSIVFNLSR